MDKNISLKIRQSESKETVNIERKKSDAPKVLGCMIQADGNWTTEQRRWERTALDFAIKVKKVRFDRLCGSKLYPVYWMSKFRYLASIVCFDKIYCDDVEKSGSSMLVGNRLQYALSYSSGIWIASIWRYGLGVLLQCHDT